MSRKMELAIMFLLILIVLASALILLSVRPAQAWETETSWYSVASCKEEGTWQKYNGRMANGEKFSDELLVAASWDYAFGQRLLVTNRSNGRQVVVVVKDRGPNRKLYNKGRRLDLSKLAFSRIAKLEKGVIRVDVKEL